MTTRTDIINVIATYGDTPRNELPDWLRCPGDAHGFALSSAHLFHQTGEATPVYDGAGRLITFQHRRLSS